MSGLEGRNTPGRWEEGALMAQSVLREEGAAVGAEAEVRGGRLGWSLQVITSTLSFTLNTGSGGGVTARRDTFCLWFERNN